MLLNVLLMILNVCETFSLNRTLGGIIKENLYKEEFERKERRKIVVTQSLGRVNFKYHI